MSRPCLAVTRSVFGLSVVEESVALLKKGGRSRRKYYKPT